MFDKITFFVRLIKKTFKTFVDYLIIINSVNALHFRQQEDLKSCENSNFVPSFETVRYF